MLERTRFPVVAEAFILSVRLRSSTSTLASESTATLADPSACIGLNANTLIRMPSWAIWNEYSTVVAQLADASHSQAGKVYSVLHMCLIVSQENLGISPRFHAHVKRGCCIAPSRESNASLFIPWHACGSREKLTWKRVVDSHMGYRARISLHCAC